MYRDNGLPSAGFDSGSLPPGWAINGQWAITSTPSCSTSCELGPFAFAGLSGLCNCKFPSQSCPESKLSTPWIALPTITAGQLLALEFCFLGFIDGFTCNFLVIEHQTGSLQYKLGQGAFVCSSNFTLPPYDISAFAGSSVRIHWIRGEVDVEGDGYMRIDNVSIELRPAGPDCNGNLVADHCDISNGTSKDCNANGVPDECDITSAASSDCDGNAVPDECDIAAGTLQDCDGDGAPDSCAIASGSVPDCNANTIPDSCDIASGASNDFDGNLVPDECQCNQTHFYCVGATNSTGKGATIGYTGSTSITLNHLGLTVEDCPPNQVGIFFFGSFKTQSPFGEGFLCVSGNQKRLLPAVFLNASGAGSYQVNFADPNSPASTIQPLSEYNFQFWYRDPQLVGTGFNLSSALHLHFCP